MKLGDWRDRFLTPSRDLYGRLTPSQRLSLFTLGGVVVVGLGILVLTSPSASLLTFRGSQLSPEFKEVLESEGIEYQTNDRNEVMIPAEKSDELLAHAFELGLDEGEADIFNWIWGQASLQETTGRFRTKVSLSHKKKLERVLAGFEGVESGTVIAKEVADFGVFKSRNDRASTGVQLQLEPGSKLTRRKARVIGRFVSRSLNVPLSRIELTDQHGTPYEVTGSVGDAGGDDKRAREQLIRSKVETLLDMQFAAHEFQVTVDLRLNYDHEERSLLKVDPGNTAKVEKSNYLEEKSTPRPASHSPGTKSNTALNGSSGEGSGTAAQTYKRTETEYSNEIGRETSKVTSRPGKEEALNITVVISEEAIRQKVTEDKTIYEGTEDYKPTRADVESFCGKCKEDIENISSLGREHVFAKVSGVKRRPLPMADELEPVGFLAFAQSHVREIVLSLLALVSSVLLYRLARGGVPELEELPDPVTDLQQFLSEKEERDRQALVVAALAAEEEQENAADAAWEQTPEDREAAELLNVIGDYVSENPKETASLLKVWLAAEETTQISEEEENPA